MAAVFALSKFKRTQKIDVKSVHSCFFWTGNGFDPRLALLVCPKVVRYFVYTNMVHCVTDHFFVQREVRSTSRTHAKQGFGSPPPEDGLGRFGGKKVHRTFFCVRLTPSRVFALPKSGPLFSVQEGGTLRNGPFLMRLTIFLHWMYSNDIRRIYYVT